MSNINVNNITPLAGESGTVSVSGSLLVKGTVTANGNIILGDANTDSISLGAEISSSIVPDADNVYNLGSHANKYWKTIFVRTASIGEVSSSLIPSDDNTYDLGSSTSEWKDLYVDGVANIDTLGAATDGVTTAFINILSSSNSDMAGGGISCSVALIPSTDNKYDLGSSTLEWKDLYLDGVAYIDTLDAVNSTGNTVLGNAASDTHTITGNITSSGNISGSTSVNTITVTATSLGGTLTTAAQANITSVGTLGSLAVGNITSTGNITAISSSNIWLSASSGIYGTLQTAAQPNVTSLGTLTSITSTGASVLGNAVSDTHTFTGHITASGNITASGTIQANGAIEAGGAITAGGRVTSTALTSTGNSSLGDANTDTHEIIGTITHTLGDITTTGNITASGVISASGDIYADELKLKTKKIWEFDQAGEVERITIGSANSFSGSLEISASSQNPAFLNVVGNITSSGNITASGTIQADSGMVAGGSLTIGANTILGSAVTDTHIFTGNVTASGNLSGSGDALFAEGTGTFKSGSIGNLAVTDALFVAQDIIHSGDTDTKITLAADDLTITVGNEQMIKITEDGSQDKIVFGDGGDVDYEFSGTGQLKFTTDATDHAIQQHDGIEVARVFDGAALFADTELSSSGHGFGHKKPMMKTGGAEDVTVTLDASRSGGVIQIDANAANVTFILPTVNAVGKAGLHFTFVTTTAVASNKTVTIRTGGGAADNDDKIFMYGFVGATSTTDVAGDVITMPNSTTAGSVIEMTCLQGGDAEFWLAKVFSPQTITNTAS